MLKCMFLLYEYLVRGKVLIWADRNRNYNVSFTVFKNNRYPSVEHISYFLFFGATLKKIISESISFVICGGRDIRLGGS